MHKVKCIYCGKYFDRDIEEFVQIGRRYGHKKCQENADLEIIKQEKDKKELMDYINSLFGKKANWPVIQQLLKKYIEEYNYSYSGIKKALQYWYEVKKNDIKNAEGSIGIVEWIYQQAYNYNYEIWKANKINSTKNINKPNVNICKISPPIRKTVKRKPFSFLLEEESDVE